MMAMLDQDSQALTGYIAYGHSTLVLTAKSSLLIQMLYTGLHWSSIVRRPISAMCAKYLTL